MAFNLSTPEAQLAWKIATQTQAIQDAKARLERQARNNVTAQLAPYGQTVDDYDSTFSGIYNPVANQQQAQAQAMQRYVTGLPELLDRVRKEQTANSRGSGSGAPSQIPFVSQYVDPQTQLDAIYRLIHPYKDTQPGYNVSPILKPGFKFSNTGTVKPKYTTNPTGAFG